MRTDMGVSCGGNQPGCTGKMTWVPERIENGKVVAGYFFCKPCNRKYYID